MHAYLIIAHNNFDQLQLLINLLDDKRNDIFIHIDKKAGNLPLLKVSKSNLTVLNKRLDVRWGDVSQIEVELLLFQTAINKKKYEYYHLISGSDLPIKTNNYIHDFFQTNKGKEFVAFSEASPKRLKRKACYYHILTRYYKQNNVLLKIITLITRRILEIIINLFLIRNETNCLKKGANWVSITHEFCEYLVERKDFLLKRYKHTRCCDEIFIQTLLWNSPFKNNIYNTKEEFKGCMRLIDWNRGRPYVWGANELYDENIVSSSERLFARKFDMDKYPEIVSHIKKMLINEQ